MVRNDSWFECDDGTKLFLRRRPVGSDKPLALVNIVHGMAEHSGRYERLAEWLAGAEIEVWAADMRGHGKTADLNVNGPGRGGLMGHCADVDGFERVTADLHLLNRKIRSLYPDVPLFLLGHSWGSFIVQNYIEAYAGDLAAEGRGINGCILSGSRGPDGLKTMAGLPLMTFLSFVFGRRGSSSITRALVDGPYNKPFRPGRTSFDWLSRDEKEVDAYVNDPMCGNLCSTGFYRDLVSGLCRIHQTEAMSRIDPALPVYIFSGSTDPVGEMGASPTALLNAYRALGLNDIDFVLYPDARHETLNETNREEVTENLAAWIKRHSDCFQPGVSHTEG